MNKRLAQGNLLSQPGQVEKVITGALIMHASGEALNVLISEKLSSGTAVVIDVPEGQIAGHVSISVNDGKGYATYINVEAIRPSAGDLVRLLEAVGTRGDEPADSPAGSEHQVAPVRVRRPGAG